MCYKWQAHTAGARPLLFGNKSGNPKSKQQGVRIVQTLEGRALMKSDWLLLHYYYMLTRINTINYTSLHLIAILLPGFASTQSRQTWQSRIFCQFYVEVQRGSRCCNPGWPQTWILVRKGSKWSKKARCLHFRIEINAVWAWPWYHIIKACWTGYPEVLQR